MKTLFTCFLLLVCCLANYAVAQPQLSYTPLIQNLTLPIDLKNAGDGSNRLFIVEQKGLVKIYKNGKVVKKTFPQHQ